MESCLKVNSKYMYVHTVSDYTAMIQDSNVLLDAGKPRRTQEGLHQIDQ